MRLAELCAVKKRNRVLFETFHIILIFVTLFISSRYISQDRRRDCYNPTRYHTIAFAISRVVVFDFSCVNTCVYYSCHRCVRSFTFYIGTRQRLYMAHVNGLKNFNFQTRKKQKRPQVRRHVSLSISTMRPIVCNFNQTVKFIFLYA